MSVFVKSVEFVEITIEATATAVTHTLTKSQNYANCVPFMTSHSSDNHFDCKLVDVYFTGTELNGVINFDRWTQRGNAVYIKCYVVEFYPTEVRVQQGAFDVSSTTTDTVTLPITLNDYEKTGMMFGYKNSNTAYIHNYIFTRGRVLSNNTSLDFYRNNTSGSCLGHWFVFEDLNENFKVTHKESSYSGSNNYATIDSGRCVDPLRTFLISSHASATSSDYPSRATTRVTLYSDGLAYCDKTDPSYYTIYWATQVVEFLDQTRIYTPFLLYLADQSTSTKSYQYGNHAERYPFSCDLDYSMVAPGMIQGLCRSTSAAEQANNETFMSMKLTDSNTIYMEKNAASYPMYNSHVAAVDWRGITVDLGTNSSPIPEGTGFGQSFVKSVENFRFSLTEMSGAKIFTKGQDWKNCVIFSSQRGTGGDRLRDNLVKATILPPGVVHLKSWTYSTHIIDISIVEFWPNQIKVQQKDIYNTRTGTFNVAIDEVSDINKCFVVSSIISPSSTYVANSSMMRISLTSTTNVELYVTNTGYPLDACFFVVEDLGDNFDTRHTTVNFAGSSASWYNDEFNWAKENSFILNSYASANTSDLPTRVYTRAYWRSEFNPCYTNKHDISYYTVYSYITAVKFRNQDNHVFHTNPSMTSAATYTSTHNLQNSNALTAYNTSQQSTFSCNTSAEQGISDAFGTITITNYETKAFEVSKGAHGYNSYASCSIIDWIGSNYQSENNILPAIPTRSPILSIQVEKYETTSGYISIPLSKGQNIEKCVPFLTSSSTASDNEPYRAYKTIYRYENPDNFTVKFGADATSNRKVTCNIVEFNPDVKIQYGCGSEVGATKTFTIEKVNLDRAFLVFYANSDSNENFIRNHAVCGRFSSDTELTFVRAYTGDYMFISWYVVECPEDGENSFWKAQHVYDTGKGGTATINVTLPSRMEHSRTMVLASWTTNASNDYPSRNTYRMRHRIHNVIEFSKQDPSYYSMMNVNIEAVEFSREWHAKGFRVIGDFITLNGATTVVASDLKLEECDYFDLNRSMVISGNQQNEGRSDTSAEQGFDEGYHHYELTDGNTVTAMKTGGASYNTYSYFFVYQWPAYNKYYMEGTVIAEGLPVNREVFAYRTLTGELVDSTTSSGGYFFVESPYYDEHYVVCLDDTVDINYNHLIYGKLIPAVISGTASYNSGLVTTSGLDIGVPIGRL